MKILICDDEQDALRDMEKLIRFHMNEMYPEVHFEIKIFSTTFSLMEYLDEKDTDVDAIFMDIYLKDENGIALAKKILEEYSHIKIIFFTGVVEYITDVFEIMPFYVLIKPVQDDKLRAVLQKLEEAGRGEEKTYLTVKETQKISRIVQNDILYIESDGRYVRIKTAEKTIVSIAKLEDVIKCLGKQFIRCHKSYIVNKNEIQSFDYTKLVLSNNEEIPVSRQYRSEVRKVMTDMILKG